MDKSASHPKQGSGRTRQEPSAGGEQRRVQYRGQVQGVGFRLTTRRIAQRFAVTGFVRNLSNGAVELVAEGPAAELDGFLAAVSAAFAENIDDMTTAVGGAEGRFTVFDIRM